MYRDLACRLRESFRSRNALCWKWLLRLIERGVQGKCAEAVFEVDRGVDVTAWTTFFVVAMPLLRCVLKWSCQKKLQEKKREDGGASILSG